MRTPLTLLYVPGDRPDRVPKAFGSGADVVIVDLEDAVAPEAKDAARATAVKVLSAPVGVSVQVRINAVGSPWHEPDLAATVALPPEVGIRIPKCEDPVRVREIVDRLAPHPAHLLVESALGMERAFDLVTCHDRVASIALGEADLRADLGVGTSSGLAYARGRVVSAAAAAGRPPPSMSVFADIRDLDGLRASSIEGRALGFVGRAAIHPRQLAAIVEVFTPSAAERRWAEEILAGASDASADGSGAIALPDGRFVDLAVVRQARRTLNLGRPGHDA